jgi:hypothetical protein
MTEDNPTPGPIYGSADHARLITFGRHTGTQHALAWLAFAHLPESLQTFARPLYAVACELVRRITTDSPELATALNRLIEVKDWTVRAAIIDSQGRPGPVPRPAAVVDPPSRFETAREITRPIVDGPQA